jgi:hypothetical protein
MSSNQKIPGWRSARLPRRRCERAADRSTSLRDRARVVRCRRSRPRCVITRADRVSSGIIVAPLPGSVDQEAPAWVIFQCAVRSVPAHDLLLIASPPAMSVHLIWFPAGSCGSRGTVQRRSVQLCPVLPSGFASAAGRSASAGDARAPARQALQRSYSPNPLQQRPGRHRPKCSGCGRNSASDRPNCHGLVLLLRHMRSTE